jgi:hypothetical protein
MDQGHQPDQDVADHLLPLNALPAAFHVWHRLRKVHPPDGIWAIPGKV